MIRFIILLLFTVSLKCQSQSFEGMITYEINHEYFDSSTKDKKLMPSKLEYYISGELARIDQHTKIGVQTSIIDTLLKKHILLIQLMDKKFGIIIENEINNTEKTTYLSNSVGLCFSTHKVLSVNLSIRVLSSNVIIYVQKLQ